MLQVQLDLVHLQRVFLAGEAERLQLGTGPDQHVTHAFEFSLGHFALRHRLGRSQRGCIVDYKLPKNRIENSDIEDVYKAHGGIVIAAERCSKLKNIVSPGLLTFFYYVMVNQNPVLAERMIRTMEYPSPVGFDDPFYVLRAQLQNSRGGRVGTLTIIAWMIKAANAAFAEKQIKQLNWRNQGEKPEPFPVLSVLAKK